MRLCKQFSSYQRCLKIEMISEKLCLQYVLGTRTVVHVVFH